MISSHLQIAFDHRLRELAILECAKRAKKFKPKVIVSSGLSGNLVAVEVAKILKVELGVVRKQNEDSHGYEFECIGFMKADNFAYVIVDDFISDGDTVKGIVRKLNEATPVGIILYASGDRGKTYEIDERQIPISTFNVNEN